MENMHAQIWEAERQWDHTAEPFEQWLADVRRLTGIRDFDGDQEEDGYSLDEMSDRFDAGDTPAQYAAELNARLEHVRGKHDDV